MASKSFADTSASFFVLASSACAALSARKRFVDAVWLSGDHFSDRAAAGALGRGQRDRRSGILEHIIGCGEFFHPETGLLAVSPSWSCEVRTIRIFIANLLLFRFGPCRRRLRDLSCCVKAHHFGCDATNSSSPDGQGMPGQSLCGGSDSQDSRHAPIHRMSGARFARARWVYPRWTS